MSSSDSALIRRAKRDPSAFGALYDRYVDRIYNYVLYRVGDMGDAEDLTARVFQQALYKMPGYEDRGAPFGAWLYRIAHNLIANWYRDTGRYTQVPYETLDTEPDRHEGSETVGDLLAAAPEGNRRWFAALRELAAERGLEQLSMGTTQDYVVAVEEGATVIRVGTRLYR